MKKWIAAMLCTALLLGLFACAKKTPAVSTTEQEGTGAVAGGWTNAEDFKMTDALRMVFEKGLDGLVGVGYEPLAHLGTQVVAGTNHCFLAQATVVYPDAKPTYALVYLYEALDGAVSLMNIATLGIVPNADGTVAAVSEEQLAGGWTYAESPEVTDALTALLEKATEGLVGAAYTPVAYLGSQVVAGSNHCLLCQVTPVVPDPQPNYVLVYIYENLEGGAELMQTIDLDVGALCTYGG